MGKDDPFIANYKPKTTLDKRLKAKFLKMRLDGLVSKEDQGLAMPAGLSTLEQEAEFMKQRENNLLDPEEFE